MATTRCPFMARPFRSLAVYYRTMSFAPLTFYDGTGDVASVRQQGNPMTNAVTAVPAAPTEAAIARFEAEFAFETDCWDTHAAMTSGNPGFVLLDVRGPALFE